MGFEKFERVTPKMFNPLPPEEPEDDGGFLNFRKCPTCGTWYYRTHECSG